MASVLDILPDSGASFGTTSPQEDAGRPLGLVDKILAAFGHSVANGVMAPGRVLASKQPITSDQMVAPAMDLTSMLTLGAGAAPAEANSLRMGIKAYHGSPHDFDKFDLSKIGTGEGAQAYGHGLYFADSEGVAKSYRDALKYKGTDWQNPESVAQFWSDQFGGDRAKAIQQLERSIAAKSQRGPPDPAVRGAISFLETDKPFSAPPPTGHMYEVNINADPAHFLDWDKPLSQQPAVASKLGYSPRTQDEINAEATALFDKHGPYPNMSPEVKGRIAELQTELDKRAPDVAGADYYRQSDPNNFLHSMLSGNSMPERSNQLLQSGIPGIKYLDQGSRTPKTLLEGKPIPPDHDAALLAAEKLDLHGTPEAAIASLRDNAINGHPYVRQSSQEAADLLASGKLARSVPQGTSNYVVFNDKLIDIMRKYGLAGLLGGAGLSQMPQDRQ